ncbi:hypothetical protein MKW94_007899 [Papaver nudicaule]|uniref:Uncharacterized protein n=1 Tax=Papaver nudicaule TaxID=74823 RepID=A0AA41RNT8_PAPNU|nr:hypothetical protein [Papaver nudicaule]
MLQGGSIFAQSPSFNSHSSDNFAEIAAKVCEEFVDDRVQLGLEPEENDGEIVKHDDLQEEEKPNEEEDDEFEFCFLSGDGIAISADEIFADGQIRPVFPVFNRDLLFAGGKDYKDEEDNYEPKKKKNLSLRKLFIGETREEEEDVLNSCSSSEADELENLHAGTYCVWKPKQSVSSPGGANEESPLMMVVDLFRVTPALGCSETKNKRIAQQLLVKMSQQTP